MKTIMGIAMFLFVMGQCIPDDLVGEKISDTEVKITRTSVNIVKVADLLKTRLQVLQQKARVEESYAQRIAQLNAVLLDLDAQIQKAKEAGLTVE